MGTNCFPCRLGVIHPKPQALMENPMAALTKGAAVDPSRHTSTSNRDARIPRSGKIVGIYLWLLGTGIRTGHLEAFVARERPAGRSSKRGCVS